MDILWWTMLAFCVVTFRRIKYTKRGIEMQDDRFIVQKYSRHCVASKLHILS